MLVDLHLHSNFSRDGKASMEDYCKVARSRNIKKLCFTEHVDYHVLQDRMDLSFNVSDYFYRVEILKERYEDMTIYTGLEVGDPYLYGEEFQKLVKSYSFDLIIASAHLFDGLFIGDREYLKGKERSFIFKEYFKAIERILDYPFFDCLGHLDFPKRYLKGEKAYPMDLLEKILKETITLGKGIEVNTSALRRGCEEPCPGEEILTLYRQLGGEILILGSDSHDPMDVGSGIWEAQRLLRKTGFNSHYVFKGRKGIKVQLAL